MTLNILRNMSAASAIAVIMLIGTAIAPPYAEAHVARCVKRQELVEHLGRRFKERLKAIGFVSSGGLMELYVSETGTWTIILTRPDGIACIGAAGNYWEELPTIPTDPQA